MRRSLGPLAVATWSWLVLWPSLAPAAAPAAVPAPRAAIDAQDALAYVKVLSAPDMEGRGALTAGLGRAGDYLAARFHALGLAGGGDRAAAGGGIGSVGIGSGGIGSGGIGSAIYFEAVELPLPRKVGPRTALTLAGRPLQVGRDYAPGGASAGARAVAGMVFAGYGVVVPGRYDDYAGIDPRGKLVICLRYAPHYDRKSGKAADPAFTDGAALAVKVATAIQRGAVAVAIVDPPTGEAAAAAPRAAQAEPTKVEDVAPLPSFTPLSTPAPAAAPSGGAAGSAAASRVAVFHLGRAAADRLFGLVGKSVAAAYQQIERSGRPASFELPSYADLTVDWQLASVHSRNVVAVLEGSDPALRDEAILIGAHYDHLGRGDEGSALGPRGPLYPGADDNASGTAAVLEVAEALVAERPRPKRSIIFAAFTGEERGLLGSAVLAGRAGGKRVVAMINLDMVGRMKDNTVEIGGSTTAADLEAVVTRANQEHLKLTFPKLVVPNSDHASFLNQQIPALFLFTGLHPDYHRTSDTWDKINGEGLAKTARLAFRIVRALADRDARLAFVAPQWTHMGPLGGAHGASVRLGLMPDYQSQDGLRVSAVMTGGAGAAAGLLAGDSIQAIGGKPVENIESYMTALSAFKPGDRTVVEVRRAGTVRQLKVQFTVPDDSPPVSPAAVPTTPMMTPSPSPPPPTVAPATTGGKTARP
jgi:Zn-dependent M28 family amino/carboxypeptidase